VSGAANAVDLATGVAALRAGAALAAAPAADVLDLVGPDARRFLNGYVTCDLVELEPGRHARGFASDLKGHVLAALDVLALADRLRLRLPAGRGAELAAHLGRYLLADRVELAPRPELGRLELRGAAVPALLAALAVEAPAPARHGAAILGGAELLLARADRPGPPRFVLWGEAAALAAARGALVGAGALLVTAGALEVVRVEDGELAFGVDFDTDAFPQECGDQAAVSFTKGCYLGQEVVARIHYRGGIQRLPRGLRFGAAPPRGAVVLHEGREAGRATSVVRSPRHGPIGLALLHRRIGEPPVRLALADGGEVEAVALPFA
jgi:folate-binding protein YgfZ